MPFGYQATILRVDLQANPNDLYVFGDNLAGAGLGGQAKEMRGEPNAVGIATKRLPAYTPDAYLSDADFDEWRKRVDPVFARLATALHNWETVIWPAHGIGTGRAQLARRAPRIWITLERARERLEDIALGRGPLMGDHKMPG